MEQSDYTTIAQEMCGQAAWSFMRVPEVLEALGQIEKSQVPFKYA